MGKNQLLNRQAVVSTMLQGVQLKDVFLPAAHCETWTTTGVVTVPSEYVARRVGLKMHGTLSKAIMQYSPTKIS